MVRKMKEKFIYLVQHGEAVEKQVNPERPLTDTGRETIQKMARFLESNRICIDVIWHSPKLRARQTAEIFGSSLNIHSLHEYKELDPDESVKKTAKLIQKAQQQKIMIVGHLPHLSRLAGLLLTGDENQELITFEKGSILCLNYQDIGVSLIRWFILPSLITS